MTPDPPRWTTSSHEIRYGRGGLGQPRPGQGPTTLPGAGHVPVTRGWWSDPRGFRRLLTWDPATGELTLEPGHRERAELLAVIPNRVILGAVLNGWADECDKTNSQEWLRRQVAFLQDTS